MNNNSLAYYYAEIDTPKSTRDPFTGHRSWMPTTGPAKKKKSDKYYNNPYRNINNEGNYTLTSENVEKAKLVQASYRAYNEGMDAAQKYLDKEAFGDWKILPESNDTGLVLRDGEGTIKVAYRGTQTTEEMAENLSKGLGKEKLNLNVEQRQIEDVLANVGDIDELIGHSRGGTKAIDLGNTYNIDTETYNPYITRNLIDDQLINDNITHDIITTTQDPFSIGKHFYNEEGNWNPMEITPKGGKGFIPSHSHSNFSEREATDFTPEQESFLFEDSIEEKLANVQTSASKVHEAMMMEDMHETLQEDGTFTDFVKKFSKGDYIDGKLTPRINKEAPMVKVWEELGGEFNEVENAHLDNATHAPKGQRTKVHTTEEDIATFRKNPKAFVKDSLKNAQVDIDTLNAKVKPHEDMAESLVDESLPPEETEFHGSTGVASAIVGTLLGDQLANWVAPEPGQKHDIVSAGSSGLIADVLATGSATTALPATIAAVSGMETQKGVAALLDKIDTPDYVADPVSSAVGGATAGGLYAFGAAIAEGATIGEAAAPETLGAAAILGGLLGASVGAYQVISDHGGEVHAEHPIHDFFAGIFGMVEGEQYAPTNVAALDHEHHEEASDYEPMDLEQYDIYTQVKDADIYDDLTDEQQQVYDYLGKSLSYHGPPKGYDDPPPTPEELKKQQEVISHHPFSMVGGGG